jgi:hypothetical protein
MLVRVLVHFGTFLCDQRIGDYAGRLPGLPRRGVRPRQVSWAVPQHNLKTAAIVLLIYE